MKRIISVLLIAVLIAAVIVLSAIGENTLLIQDDAELLCESDREAVCQAMEPICAYCTPVFLSFPTGGEEKSTLTKAKEFQSERLGDEDGIIFVIDMANRVIDIYASDRMLPILTVPSANAIVDSIYKLASAGNYQQCACEAFRQIYMKLQESEGMKSPAPESSRIRMMKDEYEKAHALMLEMSRTGGLGTGKKLAGFRSCIYAIDRLNQLSADETGALVVQESTISSLLDITDRFFDELEKGSDVIPVYSKLMEQLLNLQNELDGI